MKEFAKDMKIASGNGAGNFHVFQAVRKIIIWKNDRILNRRFIDVKI